MLRWTIAKPALVHQGIEESIDSRDPRDLVVLERSLKVAWWPRARDKKVAPAALVEGEQIHRESEDVVQREGSHDDLYPGAKEVAHKREQLRSVGHQVSVGEHGALRYTGGATGVLERSQRIGANALEVVLG
jgi:hypothetical protein